MLVIANEDKVIRHPKYQDEGDILQEEVLDQQQPIRSLTGVMLPDLSERLCWRIYLLLPSLYFVHDDVENDSDQQINRTIGD